MIIRNIMALWAAVLLLFASPGLAAGPPPHEALYHAFVESLGAEGLWINGNAERAETKDAGAYGYTPVEGAALLFRYDGNELVSCVMEIDEHTYAFGFLSELLACFILAVDDPSTAFDEAYALGTHLTDTLRETEFPTVWASRVDRGRVRLELRQYRLSESIAEDNSQKTILLVQLTAVFGL